MIYSLITVAFIPGDTFIESLHQNKNEKENVTFSVIASLRRLNIPSILFFSEFYLEFSHWNHRGF